MTGYESIMVAILGRLKAAPTNWGLGVADVRRAHRTAVPKSGTPAVHLVDGVDEPRKGETLRDCVTRDGAFITRLFLRNDLGPSVADPFKVETMRRMSAETAPYADGVVVTPGRISVNDEVADTDSIVVDMEFSASYRTTRWTL